MKTSSPYWLLAAILAGCGARSHAPEAEPDAGQGPTPLDDEPAVAEPDETPDPSPDELPEPRGFCDARAECCRNADCEPGQLCGDCPECPGARQCGWPLLDGCPAGDLYAPAPLSNVMLLVDRSASMDDTLERSRKWDVLRDGLAGALPELEGAYRFGLTMLPAEHGGCGAPEVALEPDTEQGDAITAILADREPLFARPLGDALTAMADLRAMSDPERADIAVLLTDGGETCGRDPEAAAEALASRDPPLDLYVVVIGDDTDPVRDVALAAGTFAELGWGTTAGAIGDALRAIVDGAVPCRIALGNVDEGVEPSLYDDAGDLVPHDPDGHVGWRLVDGGRVLELHGSTCRALRTGAPFTIVWPCRAR